MPRVEPLTREELAEFEPFFAMIEGAMGFVPNSMLTLGRNPELLRAFAGLSGAVLMAGRIPRELKQLVALVASQAAGCRYCQAHTAHAASEIGVAAEKLAAAFEFESSDLFDAREKAALRIARDAAVVPNATTDEQFEALHRFFERRRDHRDRRRDLDVRLAESLERHDGDRAREQPARVRASRARGPGLGRSVATRVETASVRRPVAGSPYSLRVPACRVALRVESCERGTARSRSTRSGLPMKARAKETAAALPPSTTSSPRRACSCRSRSGARRTAAPRERDVVERDARAGGSRDSRRVRGRERPSRKAVKVSSGFSSERSLKGLPGQIRKPTRPAPSTSAIASSTSTGKRTRFSTDPP